MYENHICEILYRPEFFSSLIFTTAQLVFITANCFHINIPDLTTDNLSLRKKSILRSNFNYLSEMIQAWHSLY